MHCPSLKSLVCVDISGIGTALLAHYSVAWPLISLEKPFCHSLSPGWQGKGKHFDAKGQSPWKLFCDIQNQLYKVLFNLIFIVAPGTQGGGVLVLCVCLVHYGTCQVFFFFIPFPSLFIFLFYIELYVSFKHPYVPNQSWLFWKDKYVYKFPVLNSAIIYF